MLIAKFTLLEATSDAAKSVGLRLWFLCSNLQEGLLFKFEFVFTYFWGITTANLAMLSAVKYLSSEGLQFTNGDRVPKISIQKWWPLFMHYGVLMLVTVYIPFMGLANL